MFLLAEQPEPEKNSSPNCFSHRSVINSFDIRRERVMYALLTVE